MAGRGDHSVLSRPPAVRPVEPRGLRRTLIAGAGTSGAGTSDAEPDPVDRVTIDDSVRMAMLLVLERLSPAERAAFGLHDEFPFLFEEVARIVADTCRLSSVGQPQMVNSGH